MLRAIAGKVLSAHDTISDLNKSSTICNVLLFHSKSGNARTNLSNHVVLVGLLETHEHCSNLEMVLEFRGVIISKNCLIISSKLRCKGELSDGVEIFTDVAVLAARTSTQYICGVHLSERLHKL